MDEGRKERANVKHIWVEEFKWPSRGWRRSIKQSSNDVSFLPPGLDVYGRAEGGTDGRAH